MEKHSFNSLGRRDFFRSVMHVGSGLLGCSEGAFWWSPKSGTDPCLDTPRTVLLVHNLQGGRTSKGDTWWSYFTAQSRLQLSSLGEWRMLVNTACAPSLQQKPKASHRRDWIVLPASGVWSVQSSPARHLGRLAWPLVFETRKKWIISECFLTGLFPWHSQSKIRMQIKAERPIPRSDAEFYLNIAL